jgi:methylamine utilization protein MauE
MTVLNAIREVQIPLIAALLLGACGAKLVRTIRTGSMADGLGPTALFPMRMRRPLALVMCAIEGGLGLGLIVTAGRLGHGAPATCIRVGAGLMFLVATSALIELRAAKPDVGCGCFGDFSTAPVSGRTLARSAFLSVAALSTIGLPAVTELRSGADAGRLAAIMAVELIVLGALSPELGEGLIRLGYSEPCELRAMPADRTLAALRRSKHWRRHSGLITADAPVDMWRELCWRYVVFPACLRDRPAEIVFAVFLAQRRPTVHAALVDAVTGEPIAWPSPSSERRGRSRNSLAPGVTVGMLAAPTTPGRTDLPLSSDL